jgi:hypothetical protein
MRDMKTRTDERVALEAGAALVDGLEPGRVMYMPGGLNEITCGLGSTAVAHVHVLVDKGSARALQASLEAENAANAPQRALFDKHHEHKDAMAWPMKFEWADSPKPGVYSTVDYSSVGQESVKGKVLRAFSPSFFTDADLPKRKQIVAGKTYEPAPGKRGSASNPARITEVDFPFSGTFTNNPAFRNILPLWAENAGNPGLPVGKPPGAGASEHAVTTNTVMTKREELQARKTALEQQMNGLKGQEQTAEVVEQLAPLNAEMATVEAQLQTIEAQEKTVALEAMVLDQRKKDAKAAVLNAVKKGAVAAKDMKLQENLELRCTEDPSFIEVVNAMRGSPALQPRLTIQGVKIVRDSNAAVLNAFALEANPIERHRIYKMEILPRLKEGDDISLKVPLQATTITPGTLSGTLVTQRTLELLKYTFPVLSSISTDFSDQPAVLNQVINTRIVGIPNSVAYESGGAGTGWADQDVTFTDVNIKLANQTGVPITFKSSLLSSTVRRLFDEIAAAQAYALAKAMVDGLYAGITAANFTNTPTKAAQIDMGRPTIIDLGTALTKRGVPKGPTNRTVLLNPDYYGQLCKDQAIVTLAAFQKAEIIEAGVLPNVQNFRVVEAENLPTTGNLAGFAFSRSAMTMVTRLDSDYATILPGASNGIVTTVTDPDLGISVLQVQYVNHQLASATQRISLLWGIGCGLLGGASGAEPGGQNNAGQLLLSA